MQKMMKKKSVAGRYGQLNCAVWVGMGGTGWRAVAYVCPPAGGMPNSERLLLQGVIKKTVFKWPRLFRRIRGPFRV